MKISGVRSRAKSGLQIEERQWSARVTSWWLAEERSLRSWLVRRSETAVEEWKDREAAR